MRAFHIIRIINKGLFYLTLGLFITIYLGFLTEILLGFVQVLSSILLIFFWKGFSNYWLFTGAYFLLWLMNWEFMSEWALYIIGIGILPMTIAVYFLNILNTIKKEHEQSIDIQTRIETIWKQKSKKIGVKLNSTLGDAWKEICM